MDKYIIDKKKLMETETRRLTFVVIYMSVFVLVLFGLGPLVEIMATLS